MVTVLLASNPVDGHMAPLLVIAEHLSRAGHRVRFLAGHAYADVVARTGAEFICWPADGEVDHRAVIAAATAEEGQRNGGISRFARNLEREYIVTGREQYRAIREALAAEPTDVMVTEPLVIGALALACDPQPHPPIVVCGISVLLLPTRDAAPTLLPMPGLRGRLRNRLIWAGALAMLRRPQRLIRELVREVNGGDLRASFLDSAAIFDRFAQLGVAGFDYPRSDLPENLTFFGPLLGAPPRTDTLPDWWGDLDGKTVVHVSQGTIADADLEDLVLPTIRGLADRDVLVVATIGRGSPDALGPLPANARAATFIPYNELMPRVDVFVTNGGFGGLGHALAHGVPIVVAGDTEDKVETSNRVEWSGVGVNLHTGQPTAAQVAEAVDRVLAEPSFRARARGIQAEIAAAPGVEGIEAMVVELAATGRSS